MVGNESASVGDDPQTHEQQTKTTATTTTTNKSSTPTPIKIKKIFGIAFVTFLIALILDFVGMGENAIGYSVFDLYINYIYSSDTDAEFELTYTFDAIVFSGWTSDMNYGEICSEDEYDASKQFCKMETLGAALESLHTATEWFMVLLLISLLFILIFVFNEEINNLKLGFTTDALKDKLNIKKFGKYLINTQKLVILLVLLLDLISIVVGLIGVFNVMPLYIDYADERHTWGSWDMSEIDITVGASIILWIIELLFGIVACVCLFWGFHEWSV